MIKEMRLLHISLFLLSVSGKNLYNTDHYGFNCSFNCSSAQIIFIGGGKKILFHNIVLFLISKGAFLTGNCLYLSNQVSQVICEHYGKFVASGELQKPAKSPSDSGSKNTSGACGWYHLRNGESIGAVMKKV